MTASPDKSRPLLSLQAGRAFAALYVLVFHLCFVLESRTGLSLYTWFIEAGHAGVEFFFVLSGFIMVHVHRADFGRPARAPRYLWKRALRIYPTFWAVLAVFAAAQAASSGLEPALRSAEGLARAVLLLPFETWPPITAAWTLSHELLFYGLLASAFLSRRLGFAVLAAWWGAILAEMALGWAPEGLAARFLLSPYNLLFALGMGAAACWRALPRAAAWPLLAAGCAGFVLTAWAAEGPELLGEVAATLGFGAASAVIVAALAALDAAGRLRTPRWMAFLGDASYSIYLAHAPAMAFAAMLLVRAGLAASLPVAVLVALTGAVGIGAGVACHLFAERPLLRLLGGRRRARRGAA